MELLNFNQVLLGFKSTKNFVIVLAGFEPETADFRFEAYFTLVNRYLKSCFVALQRAQLTIDHVPHRFSGGKLISLLRHLPRSAG